METSDYIHSTISNRHLFFKYEIDFQKNLEFQDLVDKFSHCQNDFERFSKLVENSNRFFKPQN